MQREVLDHDLLEIITASHTSSFDLGVALRLYDRLDELPESWFAADEAPIHRFRTAALFSKSSVAFGSCLSHEHYRLWDG